MLKEKIHLPYEKFKRWLAGNGLTYKDIAMDLGVSIATISAKINGQSDFSLSEVRLLENKYQIDSNIFFNDFVA